MTTLTDFIAKVKTTGLANTNKYEVLLTKPNVVKSNDAQSLSTISMYCEQIQLPGLNISTAENRSFGEVRQAPYEKLYDNINMSFYVDANLEVKYFFDSWMAGIQDTSVRHWAFYKDYVTDISIMVLDNSNKKVHHVQLYEAYPKSVSPIQMDYAGRDVMKIQVAMNYKYWKSFRTTAYTGSDGNKISQSLESGSFDYGKFLAKQGVSQ